MIINELKSSEFNVKTLQTCSSVVRKGCGVMEYCVTLDETASTGSDDSLIKSGPGIPSPGKPRVSHQG